MRDKSSVFYPASTRYGGAAAIARREAAKRAFFQVKVPSNLRTSGVSNGPNVHSYAIGNQDIIRRETQEPQLSSSAKRIFDWIEENSLSTQNDGVRFNRKKTNKSFRFNPMSYIAPSRPPPQKPKLMAPSRFQPSNPCPPPVDFTPLPCPRKAFASPIDTKASLDPKPAIEAPTLKPLENNLAKYRSEPERPTPAVTVGPPKTPTVEPHPTAVASKKRKLPAFDETPTGPIKSTKISEATPKIKDAAVVSLNQVQKPDEAALIMKPARPAESNIVKTPAISVPLINLPNFTPSPEPKSKEDPKPFSIIGSFQTNPTSTPTSLFSFKIPEPSKEPEVSKIRTPPKPLESSRFQPPKLYSPPADFQPIFCQKRSFSAPMDTKSTEEAKPVSSNTNQTSNTTIPIVTPQAQLEKPALAFTVPPTFSFNLAKNLATSTTNSTSITTTIAPAISTATTTPTTTTTAPTITGPTSTKSETTVTTTTATPTKSETTTMATSLIGQPVKTTEALKANHTTNDIEMDVEMDSPSSVAPAQKAIFPPITSTTATTTAKSATPTSLTTTSAPSSLPTVNLPWNGIPGTTPQQPLFMPPPSFPTPTFTAPVPPPVPVLNNVSLPNGSNPFQPTSSAIRGRKILRPARRLHR